MQVRWSTHARDRALERFAIRGGYLELVRKEIESKLASGDFEAWWEHDARSWRGKERGDRLNKIVSFEFNRETIYAVVRDKDPAWIVSLLYANQYRHNKLCGMWTRQRDNISTDSHGGLSHRPFSKLRED